MKLPAALALPWSLALLLLFVGTVALQFWLWPFVTDDAYITFRYTTRLCQGLGLTFNSGEAVEGFSNPLWTLWLALPCLWGGDIPFFSQITGLFFAVVTLAALWFAAQNVSQSGAPVLALIVTALLLLNPGFQVYASLGMEVPQLAALLSWAMALTLAGLQHKKNAYFYGAAALFGLASISRPEGLLYGALWGIGLLSYFKPWREPQHWRALIGMAALIWLPFCAYLAFRLYYYGSWLPNTALAKAVPFRFRDGLGFVSVLGPPIAIGLFAFGLLPFRRLWQHPFRQASTQLIASALGICLAGLIFTWYGRDDWMAFVRFLQPAYPALLFMMVSFLFLQFEQVSAGLRQSILVLVFAITSLCSGLAFWPWARAETLAALVMRNTEPTAVAKAIQILFPEPHTLAAGRIGVLAYLNPQHTILDLYGLTDRAQALAIKASGQSGADFAFDIPANPVFERHPDLLMITRSAPRDGLAAYTAQDLAYLQPHWRCVLRFKQGYWGSYDLWVRHDIRPDLPSQCEAIIEPWQWLEPSKPPQ